MEKRKLYVAMTRDPQWFGMNYTTLTATALVALMLFIFTESFYVGLLFPPVLIVDYYFQKRDQKLLTVFFKKIQLCPPIRNKRYWGNCNSYDTRLNSQ
jgi:type IV secretory pathway VirB3-like protein